MIQIEWGPIHKIEKNHLTLNSRDQIVHSPISYCTFASKLVTRICCDIKITIDT